MTKEGIGKMDETECRILDMWPKYEDGGYVMFRDEVEYGGVTETVQGFKFYRNGPVYLSVVGADTEKWLRIEERERVKRHAPKVLDADGVEIKVGDTVWWVDDPDESYEVTGINKYGEVMFEFHVEGSTGVKGEYLTHARPDSWERLEEDAVDIVAKIALHLGDWSPSDFNEKGDSVQDRILCLVRRAKALAENGM